MKYFAAMPAEKQRILEATIQQTLAGQIAGLQRLIRIPSVKADPEPNAPFGVYLRQALDAALSMGRALGFKTRDIDGYAGVIEAGEGEESLGILVHLDVVPAGGGWTMAPFSGEVRGGRLFGRGALDNKGPAVSALYALAAVAAAGLPLKRKVQIILGCDEESGWGCMERYLRTEQPPALAFSPDAEYPLVYSEKAILQAVFRRRQSDTLLQIESGERPNVVPGKAIAIVPGEHASFIKMPGFHMRAQLKYDATEICIEGLGAHASTPEKGKNAIQALLQVMHALPLGEGKDAGAVAALAKALGMDMHGESMGLDVRDESGRFTLNPGMLHWDAEGAMLALDMRVPHSQSCKQVLSTLGDAFAPAGFWLDSMTEKPGHIVPKDSALVQTLLGVYRAQSKDTRAEPLAIGGGTYARAFKNAVAFGCEWPGEPGVAHMPDEYIEVENILRNTHMLADAIVALACNNERAPH